MPCSHEEESNRGNRRCTKDCVAGRVRALEGEDWKVFITEIGRIRMTEIHGHRMDEGEVVALTLADVPAQMADSVQGVECEWRGENSPACVLDASWESGDSLNDVYRVECLRCSEVCEGVGVQHFGKRFEADKNE